MSEPTVNGSPPPPPPPPLLVPVVSSPPPQPIATAEDKARRRTASSAVNRVFLIPFPSDPGLPDVLNLQVAHLHAQCRPFEILPAGWPTLATLSEVTGGQWRTSNYSTDPAEAGSATSSSRSAIRRWLSCHGSRPSPTCGSTRSSRGTIRRARSRTGWRNR